MTTKKLIDALTHFTMERKMDWEVCIPIEEDAHLGGTACTNVKSISVGFDWDRGRIFLIPEDKLTKYDNQEVQ